MDPVLERLQAMRPSLGRRFAATCIDIAWVLGLHFVILVCIPAQGESSSWWSLVEPYGQMLLPLHALALLPGMVIQLIWIRKRSQSIGKWLMGIRVVRRYGEPASFVRLAFVRPWFKFLLSWILVFGSGVIWLYGYDPRGLHDKIAGTRVVREKD